MALWHHVQSSDFDQCLLFLTRSKSIYRYILFVSLQLHICWCYKSRLLEVPKRKLLFKKQMYIHIFFHILLELFSAHFFVKYR